MPSTTSNRSVFRLFTFAYGLALLFWLLFTSSELYRLHVEKYPLPIDYIHFLANSLCLASGQGSLIYDNTTHVEFLNRLLQPLQIQQINTPHSPAHLALVMMPLLTMPISASYSIWVLLSVIAGIFSILALLRTQSNAQKAMMIIIAFSSYPSAQNFWYGQVAWFAFMALSLFCLAVEQKSTKLFLIATFLLSFKFQYLPFLLTVVFVFSGWRILASCLGLLIATGLLDIALLGFTGVATYIKHLLSTDPHVFMMISLRVFTIFLPQELQDTFSNLFLFIPGCGLLAWLWLKAKALSYPDLNWLLAITMLIVLTFSPHSLGYDALIIALSACLTLGRLNFSELMKLSLPGKLFCFLNYLYPVISWSIFLLTKNSYPIWLAAINIVLLSLSTMHYLSRLRLLAK